MPRLWRVLILAFLVVFGVTAMILFLRAGSWSDADPIASTLGFVLGLGSFALSAVTLALQIRADKAGAADREPARGPDDPADAGERQNAGERKPGRRARLRSVLRLGTPFAGSSAGGCLIDVALGASILGALASTLLYVHVISDHRPTRGPVPSASVSPAATSASPATTVGPGTEEPGNLIYASLGVDRIPSGYVFLVDTSPSMAERMPEVQSALARSVSALRVDDRVTVIAFDERPTILYSGPAGNALYELAVSRGSRTDIGAAVDAALDVLERPDMPSDESVILLTDGRNNPPLASPYVRPDSAAWHDLRRRADALDNGSTLPHVEVRGYAVALSPRTGADLLSSVLPGARIVQPDGEGELEQALRQPQADGPQAKARTLLARDVTRGVEVTWTGGPDVIGERPTPIQVRLTSRMERIPLHLTDLALSGPDPGAIFERVPSAVDLLPGESRTVTATLRSSGTRPDRELTLRLAATITSPWQSVLAGDLGLRFRPTLSDLGTTVLVNPAVSLPHVPLPSRPTLILSLIAIAAVLAALALGWRRRLTGVLTVRTSRDGSRRIALTGGKVTFGGTTEDRARGDRGLVRAGRRSRTGRPETIVVTYWPEGGSGPFRSEHVASGQTVELPGATVTWHR